MVVAAVLGVFRPGGLSLTTPRHPSTLSHHPHSSKQPSISTISTFSKFKVSYPKLVSLDCLVLILIFLFMVVGHIGLIESRVIFMFLLIEISLEHARV